MSEDIERHVVRKFDICQRLGKGVSLCQCFLSDAVDRVSQAKSHVIVPLNLLLIFRYVIELFLEGVWSCVEGCREEVEGSSSA